jgi:hypothetical protein
MQLLSYTQWTYWRENPIRTPTAGCLGLNFIITNFLKNNSMKQSHFLEANNISAVQEILRLLWNLIHHRAPKSPQLVPIISQMDLVYTFPYHFFRIHYNIILPSAPRSTKKSLLLQIFRPTFCMHFSSLPCMPHSSHTPSFQNPSSYWRRETINVLQFKTFNLS